MGVSKAPVASLREWIVTGDAPFVTPEVAQAAVQQGLAGLLVDRLAGRAASVSPLILDGLRDAMRGSLARGVRLAHLAGRVQGLLLARGVRALPLKGVALAEPLYGSFGLRPMVDADLLALDAWPDAIETLLVEGYRPAVRADHAVVFVCPDTGGILELHRSVTSCPGLFPLHANALWSRSLPGESPVLRRPSAEDLLVHLSLHASFQHALVLSLVQWLDFSRLFERMALDPGRVIAITREARAEAAVAAALELAGDVVGARVPEELRRALPLGARLGRWLERRRRDPLSFVAPAAPAVARVRFELAAGRRLRLLAGTLTGAPRGEGRGMRAMGRRAVRLVRRHALPSAQTWRSTVP